MNPIKLYHFFFLTILFFACRSQVKPQVKPKEKPFIVETRSLKGDTVMLVAKNIAAKEGKQVARQELWKWLLLGAIGVLIFEWYIYNRRVYL